jgi:Asp-tRNA(Asn)/Glu-tRNA(Gln) amidotransferase A subunit family amidase
VNPPAPTNEAVVEADSDDLGCFWFLAPEIPEPETDGPLASAFVGVKDCFDVEGLPTTIGIPPAGEPSPARFDSAAVRRLRQAGARVVGKTAMDQLAWTMSGQSPGFPPCRNPFAPTKMPGGSSSGSAVAVAAGLVRIAIGTDSGGSVRVPAAWCGAVGLKPTFGAIPLAGCAPLAPSLDTGGVIARSVGDCALAVSVVAHDPRLAEPPAAVRGLRVGLLEGAFEGDASVNICRSALDEWAENGAILRPVDLGWHRRALGDVYTSEFATLWGNRVDVHPDLFSAEVRAGVEAGRRVTRVEYLTAMRNVEVRRIQALAAAADVDVVASPTVPLLPPPLSDPDPTRAAGRNTRIFNGLGWPAISLPCGFLDGLPVGLQLAAVPGQDARVLAAAAQLEEILDLDPGKALLESAGASPPRGRGAPRHELRRTSWPR